MAGKYPNLLPLKIILPRGIDGYIGEIAISIKPSAYIEIKVFLAEKIKVQIVFYEKKEQYVIILTDFIYAKICLNF